MTRWSVAAPLTLLALAGCATTAEECDPARLASLPQAVACELGGGYAARQAALRARVEARLAEHRLGQDEARRLEAEAARLAGDRQAWEQRRAAMTGEITQLERDLAQARGGRQRDLATLQALRAEAQGLRERIEAADTGDLALEPEIRALTLEVERRRQAIRAILEGMDRG